MAADGADASNLKSRTASRKNNDAELKEREEHGINAISIKPMTIRQNPRDAWRWIDEMKNPEVSP